jgi:4-alpha-glucanotransferase
MKIMQFAFAGKPSDPFLPHNFTENCVAYTGTHDNDTTTGWYRNATEKERDFCRRYLARSGEDIAWDMIRAIWASNANMVLCPFQDLLGLDSIARLNFPGKASGNWSWRLPPNALNDRILERLKEINYLYGRDLYTEEEES